MFQVMNYCGHIRNWRDLCDRLGIDTALPRPEREREIIAKGYAAWKAGLPEHLNGMFAFAVRDEEANLLYCARDQFGTKPFYYYVTSAGTFLYGTLISDIISQPGFRRELNTDVLQRYLSMTYAAGEDTFYRGLKKLMPGHYLIWHDGTLQLRKYFAPSFLPENDRTLDDWADEIHSTLACVMRDVREENETAECFLSSGVDSSYVLAMSDVRVSDSCGYDDARFDESLQAARTAQILGRENIRCLVTPEQYFGAVPWVMKHMEQPLGDASAIVFAIACRAVGKHTKLCFSGEGADEFFGGYNIYRNALRYAEPLHTVYVGNTNIMREQEKRQLLLNYHPDVLPADLVRDIYRQNVGLDPLTRMMDVDIRIWLEGDIFLNVDKMSRAAGLEIRMPLTDLRIFDIVRRMPSEYKVNGGCDKIAFRKAASKVLPDEIAYRQKRGFVVPIRYWLADARYNRSVRETLFSTVAGDFFHMDKLREIWEEFIGGNSDLWRKIWTIYVFLVWYREAF